MKNLTDISISGVNFVNNTSFEVWYTVVLIFQIFLSLSVCITSILKIVRVSSGFSLLDPDATSGMRMKKWIMCFVVISNAILFISSLIEIFLFLLYVLNNDSNLEESPLMFYHSLDGWNFIPSMNTKAYIIFFFRVL